MRARHASRTAKQSGSRAERPAKNQGTRPAKKGARPARDERAGQARPAKKGTRPGRDERTSQARPAKKGTRPGRDERTSQAVEPRSGGAKKHAKARPASRDGRPGKFREDGPHGEKAESKRERAPRPARVPLSKPRGGLQVGDWLFTTREGSEQDLIDELVLANVVEPPAHVLAPSVVVSPRLPKREHQFIPLTFARQGFQVLANVRHGGARHPHAGGPRQGHRGQAREGRPIRAARVGA